MRNFVIILYHIMAFYRWIPILNMKKFLYIFIIIILVPICFFIHTSIHNIHICIIPHFMLDTKKVDEFYAFIQNKRYKETNPDEIVLISPNHFFWQKWNIATSCSDWILRYNSEKIYSENMEWLPCDLNVFKTVWDSTNISEHWIWEHFRRINKYFSGTKIYPIVASPKALEYTDFVISQIQKMRWNILVIASVDFTHYLPEDITYMHDQQSIQVLQSWTWTKKDFNELDVDCPSCLFIVNELWKFSGQSWRFWYRDSSSTIAWKDMDKENTSRVFMYYE